MGAMLKVNAAAIALTIAFASPAIALEEGAAPPAGDDGPRVLLSPYLLHASLLSSLEIDGVEPVEDAAGIDEVDGPRIPEPHEQRIQARKRRFRTRYRMQERTFGTSVHLSYAMLQGSVVSDSFDNGFGFTARFIYQISSANQVYLDIGYSRHDMRNPRPMFFRTAVTPDSGYAGQLEIWNPAAYFTYNFPIGASARSKPMFIPKTFIGLGPMYTFASGKVTRSGAKGTVTGRGTQPFFQFTPGVGLDVRFLEYYFVGFELRERITLPTRRPRTTAEFSIPKVYVFESSLTFTWMFY